jgi:capsular polysaccharide biosynthesis protein
MVSGIDKPNFRPLLSFKGVGNFKKVGLPEFLLKSDEPLVYQVDRGQLIESPRTLWEEPPVVFGANVPDIVAGRAPFISLPLYAMKLSNGFFNPAWGIVLNSNYELFEPSAYAARWKSPDLTQVPGFASQDGTVRLNTNLLPKKILRGNLLVLNHWGSRNYGHFVLDSLPGIFLFYREILQGRLRIVTGTLQYWQREFLEILGVNGRQIISVENDAFVRCESLVWPSSVQGNLHRPSPFTRIVGTYLAALIGDQGSTAVPERIYISRARMKDNSLSRKLENEADLIRHLLQLGFTVVYPEQQSVAEQIALFSKARVIVGESGAGMANIIFAPPSCSVIEIMPELKNRVWIKQLCGLFGFSWFCVYASVPPEQRTITTIQGVQYDDLSFSYKVNIEYVIEAVRRAITREENLKNITPP